MGRMVKPLLLFAAIAVFVGGFWFLPDGDPDAFNSLAGVSETPNSTESVATNRTVQNELVLLPLVSNSEAEPTPIVEALLGIVDPGAMLVKARAELMSVDDIYNIVAGAAMPKGATGMLYSGGALSTAPKDVKLPVCTPLEPPCVPGSRFSKTGLGYKFNINSHRALDSKCYTESGAQDLRLGFPSDMAIVSILEWPYPNEQIKQEVYSNLWSDGITVVGACRYPDGAELRAGSGHMDPKTYDLVSLGKTFKSGEQWGVIGATGNNVDGSHAHYFLIECKPDGSCYWLDPADEALNITDRYRR
ncbi:MAG: hypothetical protein UU72_C0009G0016 [candidate division WWE3 bacterium GW2011_GWB1_41_6]|uniref:Uncharacterized protein n=3 Tax=Katanobacteria TaxID=422282 RepID=A0A0G0WW69_UNCKA|nr:MAG: hypothetical protein UU72_C0009G0016 [candidate division WWE3 bacterium GW2011_GWB1_41_6]